MKYIRILFVLTVAFMLCSAFTLKNKKEKEKTVYAFGVATSFNDSVAYCTEVQMLDSVELDKNGFLPGRDLYAHQLKEYLEYEKNELDYTCAIYFSNSKMKLEKEAAKMMNKIKKTKSQVLQTVKPDTFSFKKPQE